MQEPPVPVNEASRIASLVKLDVLDSEPEERFDRITRLAKYVFDVPIVLISLVDTGRQWFKSKQGLTVSETCRKSSFCAHAIAIPTTLEDSDRIMVIPDASIDNRFIDNPLVTGEPRIRFYAGFVLQSHEEFNLGTLCLIDDKPRQLTGEQKSLFYDFGMMTQNALQSLRHENKDLHTGLYNRRGFYSVIDYLLENSAGEEQVCSVIYIEFLEYTQLKQKYGGLIEKEILDEFVAALKSTFRSSDVIARIGDDKFAVLTLHSPFFNIENCFAQFKHKIQTLNASRKKEFLISFNLGSFKFEPRHMNTSGKVIDLIDKRMQESDYPISFSGDSL